MPVRSGQTFLLSAQRPSRPVRNKNIRAVAGRNVQLALRSSPRAATTLSWRQGSDIAERVPRPCWRSPDNGHHLAVAQGLRTRPSMCPISWHKDGQTGDSTQRSWLTKKSSLYVTAEHEAIDFGGDRAGCRAKGRRSRLRLAPRWFGNPGTGAGADTAGYGCPAAMSPARTRARIGFPVTGPNDTGAGFGCRGTGDDGGRPLIATSGSPRLPLLAIAYPPPLVAATFVCLSRRQASSVPALGQPPSSSAGRTS
jgi:hypothetical protein